MDEAQKQILVIVGGVIVGALIGSVGTMLYYRRKDGKTVAVPKSAAEIKEAPADDKESKDKKKKKSM